MSAQDGELGRLGVDEATADFIQRHLSGYPDSRLKQLLSDPATALLLIIARDQLQADADVSETQDVHASYFAEEYTVTTSGPEIDGEIPVEVDDDNNKQVDMGQVFQSFDLRFDDDILIAFKPPNSAHRKIKYRAQDSPVVGKKARTRYFWIERAGSASTDPTVFIEADKNP